MDTSQHSEQHSGQRSGQHPEQPSDAGARRGCPADADGLPRRAPLPDRAPAVGLAGDVGRLVGRARHVARAASAGGGDRELLDVLRGLLAAADLLQAAAVRTVQRAQDADAAETTESMGLQRWLRLLGRRTGGDAATLTTMAEVLRAMPTTQRLLEEGVLSADCVRRITLAARRRSRDELADLDAALAGSLDRLGHLSSEAVVGAAERFLERQREDLAEAGEDRAFDRRFVALQPALDGSGSIYGELPAEQFTTVAGALAAKAREHRTAEGDADEPTFRSWGRARADALEDLCSRWLAGERSGRRARPSMQVVVDVDTVRQLEPDASGPWGQLLSTVAGGPVQVTPRTVRRLVAEEEPVLRAVFTDDHEILGITEPTTHIPEALRAALAVRDGRSRTPAGRRPVTQCDVNHVEPRRRGGPTVLSNLVTVDRAFHPRVEDDGAWTVTVAPDGTCRYRNDDTGRTVTTLPRALRELRDPGEPPDPGPGEPPDP